MSIKEEITIKISIKEGEVIGIEGPHEGINVKVHNLDDEADEVGGLNAEPTIKVKLEGGEVVGVEDIPEGIKVEVHNLDNHISAFKYEYTIYYSNGNSCTDEAFCGHVTQEQKDSLEQQYNKIIEGMFAYVEGRLSPEEIEKIKHKYGENLFFYPMRHSEDDWSRPSTIEKVGFILVNYFGMFISTKEIEFTEMGIIDLYDWDYDFPALDFKDDEPVIGL